MAPVGRSVDQTPSNNLWAGNVAADVSEADLTALFSKHGAVDSVSVYQSRKYAFIHFKQIEDAKAAKQALQGTNLRGSSLKIQFARSAKPCKSLWVSGISSAVTQEILKGDFHQYGEIEEFKLIRESNTAYVDFVRLEDASEALKNMNGKRIGGGQIRVDYLRSNALKRHQWGDSRVPREGHFPNQSIPLPESPWMREAGGSFTQSEVKRHQQYDQISGFHPGGLRLEGPRVATFFHEPPKHRANLDVFHHSMGPNISVPPPLTGIIRPNTSVRPFVPQGKFDPHLSAPELGYITGHHKLPYSDYNSQLCVPHWRQSSAAPGMPPLPSPGVKRPERSMSGPRDLYASNAQSDSKRSRTDIGLPICETSLPSKEMHDQGLGLDHLYRLGPEVKAGSSGTLSYVQGRHPFNPTEVRTTGGQGYTEHDYIWRGVIRKGGSPVCRARCVPVGEHRGFAIPIEINCSSRAGLDSLTKHYTGAVGFEIVFFLPDSEEDFASYTEFLQYLETKHRAGVAMCEDGVTMFLVPPSDFLHKVLGVAGPARIYGVVLKFPPHAPDSTLAQPESFQPRCTDGQHVSSQDEMPQKEEKGFQVDRNRVLSEDPLPHMKRFAQPTCESLSLPAASVSSAATAQGGGLTLTPELIATLVALPPGTAKSPAPDTLQQPLDSSSTRPSLPPSAESDRALMGQTSTHYHPRPEQISYPLPEVDNQFTQRHLPQPQTFTVGLNTGNTSSVEETVNSQAQDPPFNQQGVASSVMLNSELPYQAQRYQPAAYGAGQETAEAAADKDRRYQSTLELAAKLLREIQEQKGSTPKQGSGSRQ